jgi:hypothetical protein
MTCIQSSSSFCSGLHDRAPKFSFSWYDGAQTESSTYGARRTELEVQKLAALFARTLNISSLSKDRGQERAKSNTTTPNARPELATCFVKLLLRKAAAAPSQTSNVREVIRKPRLRIREVTCEFFFFLHFLFFRCRFFYYALILLFVRKKTLS